MFGYVHVTDTPVTMPKPAAIPQPVAPQMPRKRSTGRDLYETAYFALGIVVILTSLFGGPHVHMPWHPYDDADEQG